MGSERSTWLGALAVTTLGAGLVACGADGSTEPRGVVQEPATSEAQPAPAPEQEGTRQEEEAEASELGATRPTVALPGACVPIPREPFRIDVTWFRRDGTRRARWSYDQVEAPDLDGDGRTDVLVPVPRPREPERACPTEVQYDVYVRRGDCGHLVGRIEGEVREDAGAGRSQGLADLSTHVDVMSPRDPKRNVRYAFDGTSYQVADTETFRARCSYHPADCRDPSHPVCELHGHPRIPGRPDSDALSAALGERARAAQADCNPAGPVARCEATPRFAPDGSLRSLRVTGCPRRRRCVRAHFTDLEIEPFTGQEPLQSINFQIPAP